MIRTLRSECGVALLMILWVMALLSIIVAEFAFSMRTELNITRNYKEEIENYYRAQSAIQYAFTEILNPEVDHHYLSGDTLIFGKKETEEETETETETEPGTETEDTANRDNIPLGNGFFSYRIEDEEGKIYLNKFKTDNDTNRKILKRLLELGAGLKEGVEQDTIIDSIMDWLDDDDLHKINGAEDDYYLSLDPPYECKDGPFDTVEELLMVQGVTPEILFGAENEDGDNFPGIAKFLTVWGNGRFNRYTADGTTVSIVYGEDALEETELFDEFGNPKQKHKSNHFSIIGRGFGQTEKGYRMVKAVIKVSSKNGAPSARIIHWNDNLLGYVWPEEGMETEEVALEY